jgi:hypothetical protein
MSAHIKLLIWANAHSDPSVTFMPNLDRLLFMLLFDFCQAASGRQDMIFLISKPTCKKFLALSQLYCALQPSNGSRYRLESDL